MKYFAQNVVQNIIGLSERFISPEQHLGKLETTTAD